MVSVQVTTLLNEREGSPITRVEPGRVGALVICNEDVERALVLNSSVHQSAVKVDVDLLTGPACIPAITRKSPGTRSSPAATDLLMTPILVASMRRQTADP